MSLLCSSPNRLTGSVWGGRYTLTITASIFSQEPADAKKDFFFCSYHWRSEDSFMGMFTSAVHLNRFSFSFFFIIIFFSMLCCSFAVPPPGGCVALVQ